MIFEVTRHNMYVMAYTLGFSRITIGIRAMLCRKPFLGIWSVRLNRQNNFGQMIVSEIFAFSISTIYHTDYHIT